MKKLSDLTFALLVLGVLAAAPAQAYLDPASISMALQVVIGAIAGGLIAVKMYFQRVKAFFLGRGRRAPREHEESGRVD